MIYIFLIVCTIVFLYLPTETAVSLLAVSTSAHPVTAFTYSIAHASCLHLLLNILSLILMYRPVCNMYCARFNVTPARFFLTIYACATLAGGFAASELPTVGASGLVFALLGALIILNPTWRQLKAYGWVAATIAVQIYFGKSNVLLHILAFALGAVAVCVRTFIDDRRRIYTNQ